MNNDNNLHQFSLYPADFYCACFCPHFYKAYKEKVIIERAEIVEGQEGSGSFHKRMASGLFLNNFSAVNVYENFSHNVCVGKTV